MQILETFTNSFIEVTSKLSTESSVVLQHFMGISTFLAFVNK